MLKYFLSATFLFIAAFSVAQQKKTNTVIDVKMNNFINALMQKMTLEEKIGQMKMPAVGASAPPVGSAK